MNSSLMGNEDVFELAREVREACREGRVPHDAYARTRMTTWLVRAVAGVVSLGGLVASTVLTFTLGPEVGAVVCLLLGCTSVFAPLLASNAVLRRVYRGTLRRSVVAGGASFAQPLAVPARVDQSMDRSSSSSDGGSSRG